MGRDDSAARGKREGKQRRYSNRAVIQRGRRKDYYEPLKKFQASYFKIGLIFKKM